MREGLVRSRNLVSIRLLRGTGIGFATSTLRGSGSPPAAFRQPDARTRHGPGDTAADGAGLRDVCERGALVSRILFDIRPRSDRS
jgi:hypothetical protein